MPINVHGPSHRWWVLATVCTGVFMSTLDMSIVNIALPTIKSHFKANLALTEWVVLAYILISTSLLLPFGRLADSVGRKKVFQVGFVLFSLGSALCSIAQSPVQLIVSRGVQAFGAAMLLANGFAVVAAVFPSQQRGRAMGIISTVIAGGFIVGPTVGGFLVGSLGWRSIFYVNIPIGIAATAAAGYILNEREVTPTLGQKKRFDTPGAALVVVALTALLLALTTGQEGRWGSQVVIGEFAVAAVALAAFPIRELKAAEPLIDLRFFKNRQFAFGNVAGLLSFFGGSANMLIMPFFLQLALGYYPLRTGLLMAPTFLAVAVVAPLSGWLSDRLGARILATTGLGTIVVSLIWLSTLTTQSTYIAVVMRLIVLGVGMGMFQSPNNASVMAATPSHAYGAGSGFLSLMRNVGRVIGVALAGAIVASSMVSAVGHTSLGSLQVDFMSPQREAILSAFMLGLKRAYLAAAVVCFLGMLASLVRGKAVSSR
ncbi:MAG: MFS transporter [Chloroflexi bacterium]|nr:MFS transporter [Chloroflexota bacterium]